MIGANGSAIAVSMDGSGARKPGGVSYAAVRNDNDPRPETATSETDNADRRSAVRFPIEQEVRYKVFNRNTIEVGSGRTVNMSSNGVLFTTERALAVGERLEVAVNWPAQLDHRCPLKLVTTGRVVRSDGDRAAIAIERYEFRTRGMHGMS
ncbi:MAG TPA: PilZ domain-containing protein [Bryobacteraceae bacterium]